MGIYAEMFAEEIIRQAEEGKIAYPKTTPFQGPSATEGQAEQALVEGEKIWTDIVADFPLFNKMHTLITTIKTHSDRQIALLQLSLKTDANEQSPFGTEQSPVIPTPFYGSSKTKHYGTSIQVDPREASVRVLRLDGIGKSATQGQPLSIESFNNQPELIIPSVAASLRYIISYAQAKSKARTSTR